MGCQTCGKDRTVSIVAKCSDLCHAQFKNTEHEGYVPQGIGISNNDDYISFSFCLECGQIQGQFPISEDPEFDQNLNCCDDEFEG